MRHIHFHDHAKTHAIPEGDALVAHEVPPEPKPEGKGLAKWMIPAIAGLAAFGVGMGTLGVFTDVGSEEEKQAIAATATASGMFVTWTPTPAETPRVVFAPQLQFVPTAVPPTVAPVVVTVVVERIILPTQTPEAPVLAGFPTQVPTREPTNTPRPEPTATPCVLPRGLCKR